MILLDCGWKSSNTTCSSTCSTTVHVVVYMYNVRTCTCTQHLILFSFTGGTIDSGKTVTFFSTWYLTRNSLASAEICNTDIVCTCN